MSTTTILIIALLLLAASGWILFAITSLGAQDMARELRAARQSNLDLAATRRAS